VSGAHGAHAADGGSSLPAPAELLAHRPPFLLLDELLSLDPGVSASGRWRLDPALDFFAGHFPGRPTTPGVLMVEALAQVGACALLADDAYAGRLPLFGGIERARFRRQVLPGDTLDLTVTLEKMSGRGGRGVGRATVDGQRACEATLLFVLVDP